MTYDGFDHDPATIRSPIVITTNRKRPTAERAQRSPCRLSVAVLLTRLCAGTSTPFLT